MTTTHEPDMGKGAAGRRRASRIRLHVALFLGFAVLGAGLAARATVPCGEFDMTLFELTSVKKNGAALPLPAMKAGSIANFGETQVYDPDTGAFRSLRLQWQQ